MEILNIYTPERGGGEKLYSVSLNEEEARLFSESKKKMSKSDKRLIWMSKNLASKRDREANIKAYDRDTKDFRDLSKNMALGAGIGFGTGSVIGDSIKYKSFLKSGWPINKKKAAISIAKNALLNGGLGAAAGYVGARLGGSAVNKIRSKSEKADKRYQKTADINKVASGKMSEEDFIEKYGKE